MSLNDFNKKYVEYMETVDNINEGNELQYVFGDGSIGCSIMLIGEAPGKYEVIQKKPFVGPAGKILAQFLDLIQLTRSDLYITNAIKYRLCKPGVRSGTYVNRPAKSNEIETARTFLHEEIEIVRPNIIVPMGNVPLKSLVGKSYSVGDCHGKVIDVRIHDVCVYPIYHPASLIYNRSLKDVYEADILKLRSLVNIIR